jgi:hypothetical protein
MTKTGVSGQRSGSTIRTPLWVVAAVHNGQDYACSSPHLNEMQYISSLGVTWDSTLAPATPAVTPPSDCAGPWEQCGGECWAGPTCCGEGFRCEVINQWHSQCNEAERRLAAQTAVASPILV